MTIGPLVYTQINAALEQQVITKNALITQSLVDKDYETWKSLVTDRKLKAQINADNFNDFATAFTLLERGKVEEAQFILKQMGLKKEYQVVESRSALISDAIARGDYNTWRSLVGNNYAITVNADNFGRYAQIIANVSSGKLTQSLRDMHLLRIMQAPPNFRSSR